MPSPFPPQLVRRLERVALAEGATTRLWPRPPLYLFAPTGGAEWFTRLFRETWGKIPNRSRRPIIGHWRCDPPIPRNALSPRVELLEFWRGTYRRSPAASRRASTTGGTS